MVARFFYAILAMFVIGLGFVFFSVADFLQRLLPNLNEPVLVVQNVTNFEVGTKVVAYYKAAEVVRFNNKDEFKTLLIKERKNGTLHELNATEATLNGSEIRAKGDVFYANSDGVKFRGTDRGVVYDRKNEFFTALDNFTLEKNDSVFNGRNGTYDVKNGILDANGASGWFFTKER